MQRNLDFFDLQILEGLGIYGPRNIMAVARALNVPEATLRRRLKQMRSRIFLRANVYHTNIGLKKIIVLAKAVQGLENLLFDCLDSHGYSIYLSRSFGAHEGCTAIFAIPTERCPDFEQFLDYLKEKSIAESIQYYWSTCFQTVNMKCDWYDSESKRWKFYWEDWIQEVMSQGTDLPFTLKDPPEYSMKGDETDIFILKELEIDAMISLKDIATKLNTSVPLVKYHFDKHVVGKCLLENFQIVHYPFDVEKSNGFYFTFTFCSLEKMAKFARSLLDKPFALSLGKIFGKSALFAYIYLPLTELRKFVDSLGKLVRVKFLDKYEYIFQDMEMTKRYTIPYKSFKNKSWLYEHEKYLESVNKLIEKALPSEEGKIKPMLNLQKNVVVY